MRKDLYAWLLVKGNGNLSEGVKLAAIANGYQEGQQEQSKQN